jgi:hypothetical protein
MLLDWRRELLAALGGEGQLTPQQLALVDVATRARMYVEHLDFWLLSQRSLVIARRRSVVPALRERTALADSLARTLAMLGLERRAPKVPTLEEYLAQRDDGAEAPADDPPAAYPLSSPSLTVSDTQGPPS